jgi:hypothetical protein
MKKTAARKTMMSLFVWLAASCGVVLRQEKPGKGSVRENVMFVRDAVGPCERAGCFCLGLHPHHRAHPRPRRRKLEPGAHPQRLRQPGLRPDPSRDRPDVADRTAPHAQCAARNLILRVWNAAPLRCPVCQNPMRVIAVIDDPRVVEANPPQALTLGRGHSRPPWAKARRKPTRLSALLPLPLVLAGFTALAAEQSPSRTAGQASKC